MRTLKPVAHPVPQRQPVALRDSTGGDSFKKGQEEVTPDTGRCITWGIQSLGQLCLLEAVSWPSPKHQSWQSHRKGQASVWGMAGLWVIYLYLPWRSQWIHWKHGTRNSDVHSWQDALCLHLGGSTWHTRRKIKNTQNGDFLLAQWPSLHAPSEGAWVPIQVRN